MLLQIPVLLALSLVQESGSVPTEAKGLQVLWVPQALAETSNTTAGFKFRHPLTRADVSFPKATDLRRILDQLPPVMKENGIWVSTTNAFLYTKKENLELKNLVALARARKIYVFQCELGEQPQGWKKVED